MKLLRLLLSAQCQLPGVPVTVLTVTQYSLGRLAVTHIDQVSSKFPVTKVNFHWHQLEVILEKSLEVTLK